MWQDKRLEKKPREWEGVKIVKRAHPITKQRHSEENFGQTRQHCPLENYDGDKRGVIKVTPESVARLKSLDVDI